MRTQLLQQSKSASKPICKTRKTRLNERAPARSFLCGCLHLKPEVKSLIIMERLAAYELLSKEEIPELDSVGYLLRHKKTGARVALLENADENKVFNITSAGMPPDWKLCKRIH